MLRLRLVRPLLAIVSSALVAQIVACSDASGPMAETTRSGPDEQEILARETGTPWHVDRDEAGTSRVLFPIEDTQPNPKARDDRGAADVAMQFLERHRTLLGIESPSKELELKTVLRGVEGTRAVLFRQHARGVPVDGGDVTVHFNADGSLFLVTNDVERGAMAASAKKPRLDATAAIAAAQADARSRFASLARGELAPLSPPQLLIYPTSLDAAALAFEVRLRTGRHVLRHIVDTESGRILLADDGVRHATPKKGDVVEGSGLIYTAVTPENNAVTEERKLAATVTAVKGVDGATSDEYTLAHVAHPPFAAIAAGHCTIGDCSSVVPITSSTPNKWASGKNFGPTDHTPDITAYVHIQESYAYYLERFGRRSFDDADAPLQFLTGFDALGYTQATFADDHQGGGVLTFGSLFPQRSLDVVAHEFTHGVTNNTARLEGQGEPGALSESVSDIFGQFVEHRYDPNGNPDLYGDAYFQPVRNLADPHSSPPVQMDDFSEILQPDFMGEDGKWANPGDLTMDNGGVHINCSIPSYAWHLMTFGGQHKTNKRQVMPADALGWTASETLWYDSITTLFKPRTNFRQAALRQIGHTRKGRITSSEPEARCEKIKQSDAVTCAWYAVGAVDLSETIADARSDKERAFFCAIMDSCKGPADKLPAVCAQAKPSPKLAECTQADSGTDSGTGSETVSDAGATEADLRDSCVGRADGVYCSQLASFSAIVCKNQQISGGAQCVTSQTCVGPNGPGTTIQCK